MIVIPLEMERPDEAFSGVSLSSQDQEEGCMVGALTSYTVVYIYAFIISSVLPAPDLICQNVVLWSGL